VKAKLFWLILVCIGTTLFSNCALGQSSSRGVTFYSRLKLKKIPVNVGMPFDIKQFCTTDVDSTLHGDRFFWENASIGKIKSCKIDFSLRNEIVQQITIYLTGQKYFDKAKKQAIKEFGPAVVVLNANDDIYTWTSNNGLQNVLITLIRKNQEWGAEMQINSREQ
jgi:hypothetical protein